MSYMYATNRHIFPSPQKTTTHATHKTIRKNHINPQNTPPDKVIHPSSNPPLSSRNLHLHLHLLAPTLRKALSPNQQRTRRIHAQRPDLAAARGDPALQIAIAILAASRTHTGVDPRQITNICHAVALRGRDRGRSRGRGRRGSGARTRARGGGARRRRCRRRARARARARTRRHRRRAGGRRRRGRRIRALVLIRLILILVIILSAGETTTTPLVPAERVSLLDIPLCARVDAALERGAHEARRVIGVALGAGRQILHRVGGGGRLSFGGGVVAGGGDAGFEVGGAELEEGLVVGVEGGAVVLGTVGGGVVLVGWGRWRRSG